MSAQGRVPAVTRPPDASSDASPGASGRSLLRAKTGLLHINEQRAEAPLKNLLGSCRSADASRHLLRRYPLRYCRLSAHDHGFLCPLDRSLRDLTFADCII